LRGKKRKTKSKKEKKDEMEGGFRPQMQLAGGKKIPKLKGVFAKWAEQLKEKKKKAIQKGVEKEIQKIEANQKALAQYEERKKALAEMEERKKKEAEAASKQPTESTPTQSSETQGGEMIDITPAEYYDLLNISPSDLEE